MICGFRLVEAARLAGAKAEPAVLGTRSKDSHQGVGAVLATVSCC